MLILFKQLFQDTQNIVNIKVEFFWFQGLENRLHESEFFVDG